MTTIVLQLSPPQDSALRHAATKTALAPALRAVLAQLQAAPTPLVEGAPASDAERVWYLEIADAQATAALQQLLASPGVEGAYVKPQDALPGGV